MTTPADAALSYITMASYVSRYVVASGASHLTIDSQQRFDQGPSLLLLPKMFREFFADMDTTLEAEDVHLLKCEPNYNVWFGDGESFELSSDISRMKSEIEKWEGKDGFERYLAFLQESHRHYEVSVREVLHKNFTSFFNLLRPSFLPHLLALHPFESIYSRASKYFWTERLRRVFTFGSMYMGMSPFDAPGTYSLLQYTELAEGIWYPQGGFHKVRTRCSWTSLPVPQQSPQLILPSPGRRSHCKHRHAPGCAIPPQHIHLRNHPLRRRSPRDRRRPLDWRTPDRRPGRLQRRPCLRLSTLR